MHRILSRCHAIAIKSYKHWKWKRQSKAIGFFDLRNIPSFHHDGNILIIAPHADDELIGCHQLINANKNNVTIFYCALLGSNSSLDNRKCRRNEFREYVKSIGCNSYIADSSKLVEDMVNCITMSSPTCIMLPSYIDWHPEHRLVNQLVFKIVSSMYDSGLTIGWYHVSLPIPPKYINCRIAMDKTMFRVKWNAMKEYYPSQMHIDIDRFKYIERLFSSNEYANETYITMPLDQWKQHIERGYVLVERINAMKSIVGNIREMYHQTASLYGQIMVL